MARLMAKERKKLPSSDFALPGKRSKSGGNGGYPINDLEHARDALSRVAADGTAAQKVEVKRKVEKKYPDTEVAGKKSGDRGRDRRPARGESRRSS